MNYKPEEVLLRGAILRQAVRSVDRQPQGEAVRSADRQPQAKKLFGQRIDSYKAKLFGRCSDSDKAKLFGRWIGGSCSVSESTATRRSCTVSGLTASCSVSESTSRRRCLIGGLAMRWRSSPRQVSCHVTWKSHF